MSQASGAVLFLDETGKLPLDAQASLLRTVKTGRIIRIGSERTLAVDMLIVSATNCYPEQMVEDKTFRTGLLYRLNTVRLELPPLRQRRDEIKPLAELFLARFCDSGQVPADTPQYASSQAQRSRSIRQAQSVGRYVEQVE